MLTITRKLEFDAGHRIPDHKSQCRNLHGYPPERSGKGKGSPFNIANGWQSAGVVVRGRM